MISAVAAETFDEEGRVAASFQRERQRRLASTGVGIVVVELPGEVVRDAEDGAFALGEEEFADSFDLELFLGDPFFAERLLADGAARIEFVPALAGRRKRELRFLKETQLVRIQVGVHWQIPQTESDFDEAGRRNILPQPKSEDAVPEVTLEGGEIQTLQFGAHAGEGAAEVLRMVHQVVDDAAGMRTGKQFFATRPIGPVFPQDRLVFFLLRAVEGIKGRERQLQRRFEIAEDHFPRHEVVCAVNRTEALIVEIVRNALNSQFLQGLNESRFVLAGEVAKGDPKGVGSDVAGVEWPFDLTEEVDGNALLAEAATRSLPNRKVLAGMGMPVFQASEGEPLRHDVPTAAHDGEGIRSRPPSLLQAVEGEGSLLARNDVRLFFYDEIVWVLLDFHVHFGEESRLKIGRKCGPDLGGSGVPAYNSVVSINSGIPSMFDTDNGLSREVGSHSPIIDPLPKWLCDGRLAGEPSAILLELAERFDAACAGFSLLPESWPTFLGSRDAARFPARIGWADEPEFVEQLRAASQPLPRVDAQGSWLCSPCWCGPGIVGVVWLWSDAPRAWPQATHIELGFVAPLLLHRGSPTWRKAVEKAALDHRLEYAAALSGKLGHGFGNYLTGILGFSELSISEAAPQSTLYKYLQEVWQSATQGAQWVHLLQLFSRKLATNPLPTSLSSIVLEEAARLRSVWSQVLTFAIDVPPDLPPAAIDPDSLRKMLAHLLDNSCEAIRQAPGMVRLSARPRELSAADCLELFGGCRPGSYVEVTIQDNGVGLTPDQHGKLFHEVFFSTKPRHRGMGLAVVYSLLRAYRGGIRFRAAEPRGVVAQMYLPRHAQSEPTPELPPAGARIMVVDTDPPVREAVVRLLEQAGAKVQAFGNPHDAFRVYFQAGSVFHLVLAEVLMPGMNGYDLAQRILERDPLANFLFVTDKPSMHGLAHQDLVRKFDLVRKPFDPPQLLQTIRGALRRGLRNVTDSVS